MSRHLVRTAPRCSNLRARVQHALIQCKSPGRASRLPGFSPVQGVRVHVHDRGGGDDVIASPSAAGCVGAPPRSPSPRAPRAADDRPGLLHRAGRRRADRGRWPCRTRRAGRALCRVAPTRSARASGTAPSMPPGMSASGGPGSSVGTAPSMSVSVRAGSRLWPRELSGVCGAGSASCRARPGRRTTRTTGRGISVRRIAGATSVLPDVR